MTPKQARERNNQIADHIRAADKPPTARHVADLFGVDPKTVHRIAHERGLTIHIVKSWKALHHEGMTAAEAAAERGQKKSAAVSWAKRHGVKWLSANGQRVNIAKWRKLAAQGMTAVEAAKALGRDPSTAHRAARLHGFDFARGDRGRPSQNTETAKRLREERAKARRAEKARRDRIELSKQAAARIVLRGGVAAYPDQIREALAKTRGARVVYCHAGPGECEPAKSAARQVAEQTGARLVSWPISDGPVRQFAYAIQGAAQ